MRQISTISTHSLLRGLAQKGLSLWNKCVKSLQFRAVHSRASIWPSLPLDSCCTERLEILRSSTWNRRDPDEKMSVMGIWNSQWIQENIVYSLFRWWLTISFICLWNFVFAQFSKLHSPQLHLPELNGSLWRSFLNQTTCKLNCTLGLFLVGYTICSFACYFSACSSKNANVAMTNCFQSVSGAKKTGA